MTVYFTGTGLLDRKLDSTVVVQDAALPRLAARITVELRDRSVQEVLYAGAVRGQLPGLTQVNLRISREHKVYGWQAMDMYFDEGSVGVLIFVREP